MKKRKISMLLGITIMSIVIGNCVNKLQNVNAADSIDGAELVADLPSDEDYFIIPESGVRYLERPDMINLEKNGWQMALYEIYARRGMIFSIPEVQEYFEGKKWYNGVISEEDFTDELLNAYELQNIEILENAVAMETEEEGMLGPSTEEESVFEMQMPDGFDIGTEVSGEITGDLGLDVQNGLLYSNEDGRITDKEGNVIDYYTGISVLPNGALTDDVIIYESYFAGAGGKIIQNIPEAVDYGEDYNGSTTPIYYEENITTTVTTDEDGETQVDDDGSYFDEVVSKAWFDEYGNAIADLPPKTIMHRGVSYWRFDRYYYIDGVTYSIDDVKRARSDQNELIKPTYAMLLSDVQKIDNGSEIYLVGTEYFSQTSVVLHGGFGNLNILNGDDILAFCMYNGLAADDTPNFDVFFIEFANGRF